MRLLVLSFPDWSEEGYVDFVYFCYFILGSFSLISVSIFSVSASNDNYGICKTIALCGSTR